MDELITYTATRYRCPHCRKSYAHRATAVKHVPRCFSNPAVRSCKSCKHQQNDPDERCAVDALPSAALCSVCGESISEFQGFCNEHPNAKPIYLLRVRCTEWEADS